MTAGRRGPGMGGYWRVSIMLFSIRPLKGARKVPIEPLTPDRRRALTRQHLLAAASEVFARRGYAAATIDEVAERAGFSKGAVYSNFSSKEHLLMAVMQEQAATPVDRVAAAPPPVARRRDVYPGSIPQQP